MRERTLSSASREELVVEYPGQRVGGVWKKPVVDDEGFMEEVLGRRIPCLLR